MDGPNIIEIKNVKKYFPITGGVLKTEKARINVLNGVDLSITEGEITGLAGESGCGKSTLAKILMKLLAPSSGEILFDGKPFSDIRGKGKRLFYENVQMIFQDPYSSLNPRLKVKDIIGEMLRIRNVPGAEERSRVRKILYDIKLDKNSVNKYPHEFSGGQRQRIAIARALIVNPRLLIADEPVSALDLSTQDKILELLEELKHKYNLTILFISHDLNLMADRCNRVAVMYLGRIVEIVPGRHLMKSGTHPYVKALLNSIPVSDPSKRDNRKKLITGEVPDPENLPGGCYFNPRCPEAILRCRIEQPPMVPLNEKGHYVSCHLRAPA